MKNVPKMDLQFPFQIDSPTCSFLKSVSLYGADREEMSDEGRRIRLAYCGYRYYLIYRTYCTYCAYSNFSSNSTYRTYCEYWNYCVSRPELEPAPYGSRAHYVEDGYDPRLAGTTPNTGSYVFLSRVLLRRYVRSH